MDLRKAAFKDVEAIQELINYYAEQGLMLAKSRNTLYENLRDFTVAEEDGKIVGVGALHMVWDQLAEVRSLAVQPDKKRSGIGRRIVDTLTEEAVIYGIGTMFTLTYQPEFFQSLGFHEVPKEKLSHKVWKECINCPKFPNCDEIAMIKVIE